jgi:drug/metabolite transporter (DMT)-like permease
MANPSPTGPVLPILAVAVLAVSLAAIFIRLADAPPLVIACYRMLLAALLLAPFTWRGIRRTPFTRRTLGYTLLAGLFLAVHFAAWISSLSYTTVAASVTLVTSNPLWVALFSWLFLNRPPPMTMLLGVLLAVAGGAFIGFGDLAGGTAPLLGDALALLGAITVSAYLLLGRAAQRHGLSLAAYAGSAYAVAAVVLLPFPALAGQSYFDYPAATFGWLFLLAAVPQLIGHTGINYAMKFMEPTLVATLILLEPALAGLLALLLFEEVPGALTVTGAVILLLGVLITTRSARRTQPREEELSAS